MAYFAEEILLIMAKATKKSVVAKTTAAARAANAAKYPRATLVKVTSVAEAQEDAVQEVGEKSNRATEMVVAPSTKRTAATMVAPTKVLPKPTPQAATARAANAVKAGKATVRNAGQSMTSRRSMIRAENFGYVIKDLRIIAGIAVTLVVIMVVLHFILSAKGLA